MAPFYITGESYGGLYTPNLGWVIVNKNQDRSNQPINFVGLAVGDPVINSKYQWPTYPTTLHSYGVVNDKEEKELKSILDKAMTYLDSDCWTAFQGWNSIWADDSGGGLPGKFAEFTGSAATDNVLLGAPPAGMGYWSNYLKNATMAEAFHYDGIPTSSSAEGGDVYHTMVNSTDFCTSSSDLYAKLFVEHGIDLMIYSSTVDTLLGPPTTEAGVQSVFDVAKSLSADGATASQAYTDADKVIWRADEKDDNIAGYARCFEFAATNSSTAHRRHKQHKQPKNQQQRFCYTVVRNGGHELPSYEPRTSYDMIMRFIQGRSFDAAGDDSSLPKCAQCSGVAPFAGSSLPDCPQPPKKYYEEA